MNLRRKDERSRRGMTLIELCVVMAVMTVAVTAFTSMVVHTARQRAIHRENAIAANAARTVIERMRNEDFRDVFALFNQDALDDPGGAGSAPGKHFAVPGLTPAEDDADGLCGEIVLPEVVTTEDKGRATWGTTTLDLVSGVVDTVGDVLGGLLGGGGSGGSGGSGGGGLLGGGLLGGGGGGLLGGGENGGGLLGGLLGGTSGGSGSGGVFYPLREDCVDAGLGMPRDLNGDNLIDDKDHADDYLLLPVRVTIRWRGTFGPRELSMTTQLALLAHAEGS